MGFDEFGDDRRLPSNFAQLKAINIWHRAKMVLDDSELLQELGFEDRKEVAKVVILITAGDRLHPTKGFDFLGPDWQSVDEAERVRLLEDRQATVEGIVTRVLDTLGANGYEAAQEVARALSPFQVVFLTDSAEDTEILIQQLLNMGLGTAELSDSDSGRRGDALYFRWDENLSYFLPGDHVE